MKLKRYKLIGCLAASSLLASCFVNLGGELRSSGIVKTESREVSSFSAISSKSIGKISVQQTDKESLTISADDNILPLIESRITDNILYLTIKKDVSFIPIKPIEFVVEVKSLESLIIDGVSSIEVKGIKGKQLLIFFDGVGSMTIAGDVDVLNLDLAGVGSFQGEGLQVKQATVHHSGVGSAVVKVSEVLDVTVSGVGSVEYIGSPQVQKSVQGLGSVKKR